MSASGWEKWHPFGLRVRGAAPAIIVRSGAGGPWAYVIDVSGQAWFPRNCDGVVPVVLRNTSVKWLWLEKPRASAMSVIGARSDSSISLAFRIRRSVM